MSGRTTRRGLFATGAGIAATSVLSGCSSSSTMSSPSASTPTSTAVAVHGTTQAGVARPALPQQQLMSQVFDLEGDTQRVLAGLGRSIDELTGSAILGVVAPRDLTVTVGVGPRMVAAVDSTLPGAEDLPRYRRESIPDGARGGDLWLQVCGSDALAVSMAATTLRESLASTARLRWQQRGWRGQYAATPDGHQAGRNVMGFQDGIVGARDADELHDGVWLAAPASVAGGTIAVVRRFRIDVAGWRALDVARQQDAVGRELVSSRPLSGGVDVDLGAKTPEGSYRIPADAHIRRAHALALGVPLMLRRSYSIDDPEPGLLFISFQNTLRAFTATMQSLDESDRMLDFAATTATGTFLVLPGFSPSRPLGSTLFG
jgi:dye decolorizing peroxidase